MRRPVSSVRLRQDVRPWSGRAAGTWLRSAFRRRRHIPEALPAAGRAHGHNDVPNGLRPVRCHMRFVWDRGSSMAGAVPSVWLSIPYLVLGCTLGGYMLQNTASRMISGRRFVPDALCSAMTAKANSEASHPYGRAAPPKRSRGRIPAPASLFFAAIPIFYLPLKSLSKYGCGKNSSFHWRSGSGSLLSVLPVEWISFFKTSFSTAMSMGFAI